MHAICVSLKYVAPQVKLSLGYDQLMYNTYDDEEAGDSCFLVEYDSTEKSSSKRVVIWTSQVLTNESRLHWGLCIVCSAYSPSLCWVYVVYTHSAPHL